MELWNDKDLKPPAIVCCKATTKEIDMRLLSALLKDAIEFFENQQQLCTEAALLSRTVYRQKMKFRSSKDFKSVEKLNRVLRTYLRMEIPKLLKKLQFFIPETYKMNNMYNITKNMMDFVLVRIQGLGKLLVRILETCKVTSAYAQQRLKLGHFWNLALVMYAIASRIFVIARSIFKYVCEMYTNLLPFSTLLNNSNVQWLPKNYTFPNRLEEWLNIDWLDFENKVIEIADEEPSMSFYNLIDDSDDDDVEFCDEYVIVKDETTECVDSDGNELDFCVVAKVEDEDKVVSDKDLDNESAASPGSLDFSITVQVEDQNGNVAKEAENGSVVILNDDTDIGEVISLSDIESPQINKKKRKGRKERKSNDSVICIDEDDDSGIPNKRILLSNNNTQGNKRKKKPKKTTSNRKKKRYFNMGQ